MKLLAVDPGLRYPAIAIFDSGVLLYASRVKIKVDTKQPIVERCRDIAQSLKEAAGPADILVVEFPQIYTKEKSKGDPNNLVPLAVIGGCLSCLYPDAKVISPKPREWTGNIPKSESGDPWDSPRGQRIWGRLSPDERKAVIPSHDAIDSVGLGLFGLGRFERRRVYETS